MKKIIAIKVIIASTNETKYSLSEYINTDTNTNPNIAATVSPVIYQYNDATKKTNISKNTISPVNI